MYCSHCGRHINDGASYCAGCGAMINRPKWVEQSRRSEPTTSAERPRQDSPVEQARQPSRQVMTTQQARLAALQNNRYIKAAVDGAISGFVEVVVGGIFGKK